MITLCAFCSTGVRVLAGDTKILLSEDWFPDRYPCPNCGKNSVNLPEESIPTEIANAVRIVDLTAVEAFAAYSGAGLPEESVFDGEELSTLLREIPVKKVAYEDIPGRQGRVVVDFIELWDGTRVFFAASPEGALVYRIKRKVV